jgi:hypothetical protein
MKSEKNNILIYFNDSLIGKTSSLISYERESIYQKEYRFLNTISL